MTRAFDPDEPVFKKSRWGTNRYVYNADNPVGLTLIVVSVVFAVVMLLLMSYRAGPFAPDEPATEWTPPETGGTHRSPP
ncbi:MULTISPECIES: hypothetical protein [Streptomyces]|uniref:Uncharacterized protein n=2 Tax=Streptomyces TaxID=1883 RepID=A0A3M8EYX8_9ACTN|nr:MULTISPECIES: hypothetical protein [Streptomyces]KNE82058.1 hypothetical protein ADZ36_12875 [Streptomyces fradiae]OFA49547.1 hypothetical protein BEN35_17640 [Streptomyces fradiae]PQM21700.1 hypothetical protein Sfr7A_18830 [Streptomyces xinghaiensis]RKM93133.1 hypothetical protein SFRA_021720 [Streptomyces xinghaiensis]RNC71269.1 hypothetical protein DC095_023670 [Streptomyces xinghaiensis]